MIFRAFSLSLQSLTDKTVLILLAKTLLITAAIFALLGIGLWFGLSWIMVQWFPDGADTLIIGGVFALTFLLAWILWRVIAIAVLWFFSDDIVDAVEARHYTAHALSGRRPGAVESMKMALRSIGRTIGYNLLALPLYIILLFTGVGTGIAFLFVNALLLGRDLQEMLEARHGAAMVNFDRISRLMLGATATAAMMLPMVNLLVPVVAVAMAVHMAHLRLRPSI